MKRRPQGNWNTVPTFKEGSSAILLAMCENMTRDHYHKKRGMKIKKYFCKLGVEM